MTGSTSNQALAEAIRAAIGQYLPPAYEKALIDSVSLVLDDAVREAEGRHRVETDGLISHWVEVVKSGEKRHADELVAVREECARIADAANVAGLFLGNDIRSLDPSGSLERIQNEARLEEARKWHGNSLLRCSCVTFGCKGCERISELEKLAPERT